jgi:hypothetical protein
MDSDSASVGKGVGPSVVGQLLRDRSLRLAAGLAIAVAIPVAVLFYFQFRSISDLSKSSTVVLKQLSQETADGLTRSVEDALKMPYINTLLRTSQNQTEPLNLTSSRRPSSRGSRSSRSSIAFTSGRTSARSTAAKCSRTIARATGSTRA